MDEYLSLIGARQEAGIAQKAAAAACTAAYRAAFAVAVRETGIRVPPTSAVRTAGGAPLAALLAALQAADDAEERAIGALRAFVAQHCPQLRAVSAHW